jgi:hypothetical protein
MPEGTREKTLGIVYITDLTNVKDTGSQRRQSESLGKPPADGIVGGRNHP